MNLKSNAKRLGLAAMLATAGCGFDSSSDLGSELDPSLEDGTTEEEVNSELITQLSGPAPDGAEVAPMTLDCEDMDDAARRYATENGLCQEGGGVWTRNTVTGNCGAAWLYMKDLHQGVARFRFGSHSFWGNMASVSYRVDWYNSRNNRGGGFGRVIYPFSARWERYHLSHTGRGRVCGVMTGHVRLVWGGKCVFGEPFACNYIH